MALDNITSTILVMDYLLSALWDQGKLYRLFLLFPENDWIGQKYPFKVADTYFTIFIIMTFVLWPSKAKNAHAMKLLNIINKKGRATDKRVFSSSTKGPVLCICHFYNSHRSKSLKGFIWNLFKCLPKNPKWIIENFVLKQLCQI